jgi:hypothetical protein
MDSYKSAFKDLLDKFFKSAESLTEQNSVLKQALRDLLNEDDIKELPAYELIKNTYEPFLTDTVTSAAPTVAKSKTTAGSGVFTDPLHAPPGARFNSGSKSKIKLNVRRPIAVKEPEPASEPVATAAEHYSDQMPDMDSCLLAAAPVKTKSKSSALTAREIKIAPKQGETVYQVEIQGKKYLRYHDNFYDADTKKRVTNSFKLGQAEAPVELEPVPDYEDYYWSAGKSDTVYTLVNGEIAQAVGTYENGELALWS